MPLHLSRVSTTEWCTNGWSVACIGRGFMKWLIVVLAAFVSTFMILGCGENGLRLGYLVDKPTPNPSSAQGVAGKDPASIPSSDVVTTSVPTPTPIAVATPRATPRATTTPVAASTPLPTRTPASTQTPRRTREGISEVSADRSDSRDRASEEARSDAPTASHFVQRIVRLTNAFRKKHQLGPVKLNAALTEAAQSYAEKMALEGFFEHNSSDGTGPGERISDAGYHWNLWGENIGCGYETPENVVQAWIESAGHRVNLLNKKFTEIGVGYAVGKAPHEHSNEFSYWVQDFGSRRRAYTRQPASLDSRP